MKSPLFLHDYAKKYSLSESAATALFDKGVISGQWADGQLLIEDRPPDLRRAWLRRLVWTLALAGILWFLFHSVVYPLFRDMAWRYNFSSTMVHVEPLRAAVATRLLTPGAGEAVNAGLRIEADKQILGGYVAGDGTIVIHYALDYPDMLVDTRITVILVPRIAGSPREVRWTCGVADKERSRAVPKSTCGEILPVPPPP